MRMNRQSNHCVLKKKGFTIVELVIVIAVIAILAAVLIPTFSGIIEKAKYSSAMQAAENDFKADVYEYNSRGMTPFPDDVVYEADGYYFKSKDMQLVRIEKEEYQILLCGGVKNIIFLIPDGAGFGTYDIANALKKTTGGGVKDQATPITTDAISGMTVSGLYLDEFMIATADTHQYYSSDGATDSTAAGTALLGGYKTNSYISGLDHEANARANLLELCRLEGKATGFVSTKCLIDATPCSGNVHVLKRPDQSAGYQLDANAQYMVNGIDVLLCFGSDGGYFRDGSLMEGSLKASDFGYVTANSKATLESVVNSGAKKIFTNILNDCNGEYTTNGHLNSDYQANHIKYDCYAGSDDLTLMDMAKGAIKALSENVNDPDGFCLVIEGGAIDNACEGRRVKEGVAEYLAFDEVFGYCVNWAKQRGDTIVVACPDHDSGGFYNQDNADKTSAPKQGSQDYDSVNELVTALSNGTVGNDVTLGGNKQGHTEQNVPVWLYAPESVRMQILYNLVIPSDTNASKVRTGLYYDGTVINSEYAIDNSDISPAIVKTLGLMSFDDATDELFVQVNADDSYGSYSSDTQVFTFKNGETVKRNSNVWTKNGETHSFRTGFSIYVTNSDEYDSANFHVDGNKPAGTYPNRFYVPRSVLVDMGYISE